MNCTESVMSEFKKDNNINVIIDFIKNDTNFKYSTNVSIFTEHLDRLISSGYLISNVESYIFAIKEFEESISPKFMKYINFIKSSKESDYLTHLHLFTYLIFETEGLRKYESLFINKLMKENLDESTYQKCMDIICKEYMDFVKETSAFNSMPDYGNGRSLAFNLIVENNVKKMNNSFMKDILIKNYFDFLRQDLKFKKFKLKGKEFLFKDVNIKKYGSKLILKYTGYINGEQISVNSSE